MMLCEIMYFHTKRYLVHYIKNCYFNHLKIFFTHPQTSPLLVLKATYKHCKNQSYEKMG